ncbi:hypothetical protein BHM03_00003310 [Ensete ventricosum]|nr:hypothetical protein BHM03_00003310 [Ensete ventricosum]
MARGGGGIRWGWDGIVPAHHKQNVTPSACDWAVTAPAVSTETDEIHRSVPHVATARLIHNALPPIRPPSLSLDGAGSRSNPVSQLIYHQFLYL